MPEFAKGSPLTANAFRMALAAHGTPGSGETQIGHPVAVAELLSEEGFDETVVAAALLHDTVEDTTLTTGQIEEYFGAEVAVLVAEMTEDTRIEPYPARKAEARNRMMRDPCAAAIYAADKLANTRELLEDGEAVRGEKLDHYIKTLRLLSEGRPDLPFLSQLSEELAKLVDREAPG
jgi:(p)ppGpp synthase/HD superfamily hydrolase